MAKYVSLYTDGSCAPNPGPGGWAAVAVYSNGCVEEFSGGVGRTTNNRMEMTAALEGLLRLEPNCVVKLHTDSQYLKFGITWWIDRWRERNWLTTNGSGVKNKDLWLALLDAELRHAVVHWVWIKGHSGNCWQDRADELAERGRCLSAMGGF